ncbi:hypothetical protein CsatB_026346 [Cannabis sativa]
MAKAVLTLAVFAKEYGDFIEYHRNKYNINNDLATSDQLTDSLAFLKGWKIELLDKQKTEIRELNVLIEKTLELMNAMNELEKFSKNRKVSMDGVKADLILPEEVDYYWVIMAVIACVNKFTTILTSSYQQLENPYSLEPYIEKVKTRCMDLKHKRLIFEEDKVEDIHYYDLVKLSKSPTTGVKILTQLVSPLGYVHDLQLFDGSKKNSNMVPMDIVLEKKKWLLLVLGSKQNMSNDDIDLLRHIQFEKIKNETNTCRGDDEKQCVIIWLPIVDKDHNNLIDESFLKSKNIEWYTLNKYISDQGSLKFLEEKWDYKGTSPNVVVMDVLTGKIENTDAFYAMRLWGLDTFPFDQHSLQIKRKQMSFLFNDFSFPSKHYLANWIQEEEYIMLHGGKDENWAKEIEGKINFINENINVEHKIKHLNINQEKVEVSFEELFWRGVNCWSMNSNKVQNDSYDDMKKQLDRLCCLGKAKVGWFVLNKGPVTIVIGSQQTFEKMVEDIKIWKKNVKKNTFEVAFKEFHEKIFDNLHQEQGFGMENKKTTLGKDNSEDCCIIEYPTEEGKLRIKMDCPNCHQLIKKNIIVNYMCQK